MVKLIPSKEIVLDELAKLVLASDLIPGDLSRLFPIVDSQGSDSASF